MSLEGVLQGLYVAKGGTPVSWVDMGGGRGLAMRQLLSSEDNRERFVATNVDLIDYGLDGLTPHDNEMLDTKYPKMLDRASAPYLLQADCETVVLPDAADIITSVETVQYLDNPLAAMANWYNQLADNGIMLISAEHDWSSWIRYATNAEQRGVDNAPMEHLLEQFDAAGIRYAVAYESDQESGLRPRVDLGQFRNLALQKKPNTTMVIASEVDEVWCNDWGYKAIYYSNTSASTSPVSVIDNR